MDAAPEPSPAQAPPTEDHSIGLLDAPPPPVERVSLRPGGDEAGEVDPRAFRRLSAALGTFVGAIVLSYVIPGLSWARPWPVESDYVPFWNLIGREFMGQGADAQAAEDELAELEALARADEGADAADRDTSLAEDTAADGGDEVRLDPTVFPPWRDHPDDARAPRQSLEQPEALESFFAELTRTQMGLAGATTRVAHWGDSVLGNDGITSDIRVRMQARFGDAGHGFHSLTKYDASYRHQNVRVEYAVEWKRCYIIRQCDDDGRYGYGGVVAKSGGGSTTVFRTAAEGRPVGGAISRFELWYGAQPHGGDLEVKIDGGERAGGETHRVATASDAPEDRWESFEMADGPHTVAVRAMPNGPTRAYGVVLERDRPGVVWDGMALIGAFISRFNLHDPEHLAGQIQHRGTDLMVFTFGGNDLQGFSATRSRENFDALLTLARSSAPDAACLVTSVIDHGERKGGGVVSVDGIDRMVKLQRELALEHGCAFLDLWSAMGGKGSIGRWNRASPRLASGDLHHLTASGHKVVGGMVYRALMEAYGDYRRERAGQPLPPG